MGTPRWKAKPPLRHAPKAANVPRTGKKFERPIVRPEASKASPSPADWQRVYARQQGETV